MRPGQSHGFLARALPRAQALPVATEPKPPRPALTRQGGEEGLQGGRLADPARVMEGEPDLGPMRASGACSGQSSMGATPSGGKGWGSGLDRLRGYDWRGRQPTGAGGPGYLR